MFLFIYCSFKTSHYSKPLPYTEHQSPFLFGIFGNGSKMFALKAKVSMQVFVIRALIQSLNHGICYSLRLESFPKLQAS